MPSISNYLYSFQGVALIIALAIGFILLLLRPYWAFLFATFLVMALSVTTLTQTRAQDIGAYFNLYDVSLVISFLALLFDGERKVAFPAPAIALLAVLVMGLMVSFISLGVTYGTVRAFRWGISLPLEIILTASLVRSESRLKSLLVVLFLAVVVAELQHLFLVTEVSEITDNTGLMRTVAFYMAGSEVWLLAGPFLIAGVMPHPWLQMAAGALFLAANISHQTRSIAIAFAPGFLVYYFWFLKGPNAWRWHRFRLYIPVILGGICLLAATGLSDLPQAFANRLLKTMDTKHAIHSGLETRELAYKIEFGDWLHGNLIFGEGLNYYEKYGAGKSQTGVAWGHLGYITYLSQLGLIGFVVYGFWFPLTMLKKARKIVGSSQSSPVILYLGLLTGACFIIHPLVFTMSGSYLMREILPGVLGGAIWSMSSVTHDQASGTLNFDDRSLISGEGSCDENWEESNVKSSTA